MIQHDATLLSTYVLFTHDTDTSRYTVLNLGRKSEMGKEKRVTPEFGE
jgi:hypothetical protein